MRAFEKRMFEDLGNLKVFSLNKFGLHVLTAHDELRQTVDKLSKDLNALSDIQSADAGNPAATLQSANGCDHGVPSGPA